MRFISFLAMRYTDTTETGRGNGMQLGFHLRDRFMGGDGGEPGNTKI